MSLPTISVGREPRNSINLQSLTPEIKRIEWAFSDLSKIKKIERIAYKTVHWIFRSKKNHTIDEMSHIIIYQSR